MIKLSKYIPINELGEATSKPFYYKPHFIVKKDNYHLIISLVFNDDQNDSVQIDFATIKDKKDWEAEISTDKLLFLPPNSFSMGFSVNKVEVDDYRDDNAKAKHTNIQYYTRLLATIKSIYYDFINQYNPNCIFAGKYTSNNKNNQKETRYEVYARLFKQNIPSGYEYINLENNMVVGLIKSEFKDKIYIENDGDSY